MRNLILNVAAFLVFVALVVLAQAPDDAPPAPLESSEYPSFLVVPAGGSAIAPTTTSRISPQSARQAMSVVRWVTLLPFFAATQSRIGPRTYTFTDG